MRWYVSIYITLLYVYIPRTDQNRPRHVHLAIAIDIKKSILRVTPFNAGELKV